MSKSKQSWIGTIPLFILIVSLFTLIYIVFFVLAFTFLSTGLNLIVSIPLSLMIALIGFGLFLNIPLPRKKKDPTTDLNPENQIAEGAWCRVYHDRNDPKIVTKQLYFCGWGHNDYTKHKAFVIGKEKICGKWNPLVLSFLHNYMLLYQLIGLKRRQKFEKNIPAIPTTISVDYFGLRYTQEYILHPLTVDNCPDDIHEQFHQLNDDLEQCGLYLDDVHARNVRITNEGKIKIVDGELYSGGEEWLKSKMVVLFNGEMVSNMEKVLGNERIVAWVDHRESVDDVVQKAF